jgi:hypothetical protein
MTKIGLMLSSDRYHINIYIYFYIYIYILSIYYQVTVMSYIYIL